MGSIRGTGTLLFRGYGLRWIWPTVSVSLTLSGPPPPLYKSKPFISLVRNLSEMEPDRLTFHDGRTWKIYWKFFSLSLFLSSNIFFGRNSNRHAKGKNRRGWFNFFLPVLCFNFFFESFFRETYQKSFFPRERYDTSLLLFLGLVMWGCLRKKERNNDMRCESSTIFFYTLVFWSVFWNTENKTCPYLHDSAALMPQYLMDLFYSVDFTATKTSVFSYSEFLDLIKRLHVH